MSEPQLPKAKIISALRQRIMGDVGLIADVSDWVVALANRGYYRDSMGEKGKNDVGIFDDACFLCDLRTETILWRGRWNTDPSLLGTNHAIGKGYAILKDGIWPFRRGQHKGKGDAWRQLDEDEAKAAKLSESFADRRGRGNFQVWRGSFAKGDEWGYQAINIHWGSLNGGTSSWGCQTAPKATWPDFLKASYAATKASKQPFLPYVLTSDWLQA